MTKDLFSPALASLEVQFPPREELRSAILAGLKLLSQVETFQAEAEESAKRIAQLEREVSLQRSYLSSKEEMEKRLGKNEAILSEALAVAKALEAALPDKESSIPLSNRYHDLLSKLERN